MSPAKLKPILDLLRLPQYLKNLIIWAPLVFGHKLLDPAAAWATWWAFLCFCLLASLCYVFNDLRDAALDRLHPRKKNRPLASGAVSPDQARAVMGLLGGATLALGLAFLPFSTLGLLAVYLALNLAYTLQLKHWAVVDVLALATFFVLRIFIGGLAAGVEVSHWLVLVTFLLALFLGLAKRRDDLLQAACGNQTRPCVDGYNLEFVTASLNILAGVTIVCYILYSVSPEVMAKHGSHRLYLTVFWVVAGLLRYLQVTLVKNQSGSPTQVLLTDRFLAGVVILWAVHVLLVLYVGI